MSISCTKLPHSLQNSICDHLGFHSIVINEKMWYLCCYVEWRRLTIRTITSTINLLDWKCGSYVGQVLILVPQKINLVSDELWVFSSCKAVKISGIHIPARIIENTISSVVYNHHFLTSQRGTHPTLVWKITWRWLGTCANFIQSHNRERIKSSSRHSLLPFWHLGPVRRLRLDIFPFHVNHITVKPVIYGHCFGRPFAL